MDVWLLIAEMAGLLGLAFVLGALAQRLRQSAIVGYLLAGAILGPLLFNRSAVQDVAELGVALLLFSIGLEFSFSRLKRMGARGFTVGGLQILVTLGVFTALFAGRGPLPQALALGAIVALSSTAIVLRVLMDRMEIDAIHGRNALAILLTQDAAVVPLVLLVTVMGHGGDLHSVGMHVVRTLASAGGLAAVFYLLFYTVIPKALMTRGLFNNRELVVLLTIAIGAGSAWAAHAIGLSPALGAFIAGMLLAESPFAAQIRSDIVSLRTLFVTLFFTSIGMLADPQWFLANWTEALVWLGIVFVLKALIVFGIGVLMRIPYTAALATGITLAQIGEFSFVLAAEAHRGGILGEGEFDLIVTVTILSMFVAPYMAAHALPLAERLRGLFRKPAPPTVAPTRRPAGCAPTFIIGFGPAGQRVADQLQESGIAAAVIELNPKSAAVAQIRGLDVHMVDATSSEAVAHVGIQGSCLVIVTVPDPRSAEDIIRNIRFFAPRSTIIARSRYHIASPNLGAAGASIVVDEENTIGDELAQEVVASLKHTHREALGCALAGEKP
ncbi:MAG: cation:proton antiporter [Desulfobacterales bacterium]|nr:cation:proton antiporter [Desulfobacterales bacterium]